MEVLAHKSINFVLGLWRTSEHVILLLLFGGLAALGNSWLELSLLVCKLAKLILRVKRLSWLAIWLTFWTALLTWLATWLIS